MLTGSLMDITAPHVWSVTRVTIWSACLLLHSICASTTTVHYGQPAALPCAWLAPDTMLHTQPQHCLLQLLFDAASFACLARQTSGGMPRRTTGRSWSRIALPPALDAAPLLLPLPPPAPTHLQTMCMQCSRSCATQAPA